MATARIAGSVMVAALVLAGCAEPSVEGYACPAVAGPSVMVSVWDDLGLGIPDASVSYRLDGGPDQPAEQLYENTWVTAWETVGRFDVTASKSGYLSAQGTAVVEPSPGGCGVAGQQMDLTLVLL